ncbi:AAA family ATPase [Streptomyces sp. NPDC058525]|uniref:AAA family ATPase n=1 Tax=Streptomyces sp. NPDC058525 TaxID=3346538 RepID=UPI003646F5E7
MTTAYDEAEELMCAAGLTPGTGDLGTEDPISWAASTGSATGQKQRKAKPRRGVTGDEKERQPVLFVAESPCPALEEIEEPEWLVLDPVSKLGIAPANHVVLMSGRGGGGKTTVAIGILADVTQGTTNGVLAGVKHHVIYAAVEDSWRFTLTARFTAAGADLTHVHKFNVKNGLTGEKLRVSFPRFLDQLRERIVAENAKVVAIDPLLGVLDDGLNSAKATDVRKVLDPLAVVAEETGCTILVITHVRKNAGDAGDGVSGSHAIRDAVRCHWAFTKQRGEPTGLVQIEKNNLGSEDFPPFEYEIEEVKIKTDTKIIPTTKARLTGYSDENFDDVASKKKDEDKETHKCDEAAAEIVSILTGLGGRADSTAVINEAVARGHSRATLYRAKAGVVDVESDPKDKRRSIWVLSELPDQVVTMPVQSQIPGMHRETENETETTNKETYPDQSQSQSHTPYLESETEQLLASSSLEECQTLYDSGLGIKAVAQRTRRSPKWLCDNLTGKRIPGRPAHPDTAPGPEPTSKSPDPAKKMGRRRDFERDQQIRALHQEAVEVYGPDLKQSDGPGRTVFLAQTAARFDCHVNTVRNALKHTASES